jgi:hypothetical protein
MSVGPAKIPNISYAANADAIFPLSIAHRWNAPWKIPGRIGVGLTGKFIRRGQIKQDRLSVIGLDNYDAPPMVTGHGIGSDLGFLYQPTDRTNVGLMIRDFLGTKMKFDALAAEKGYPAVAARESVIRPQTDTGVAFVPKSLFWVLPTSDRWTFSADVRDILSKEDHIFFQNGFRRVLGENLYTHLHLGTEFRWWFLRFRGGAYQGYPTLGLGLDIPFLKIDYAFYSKELGVHAGDQREQNHVISLALRFGSGYTESRERIKKAKESNKMKMEAAPETEPEPAAPAKVEQPKAPAESPKTPAADDKKPAQDETLPQ